MESSTLKLNQNKIYSAKIIGLVFLVTIFIIITGCQTTQKIIKPEPLDSTLEIYLPIESTATPLATPVIFRSPFSTWVDPAFPETVHNQLSSLSTLIFTGNMDEALVKITANTGQLSGSLIYLAVVPFYSFNEEISSTELLSLWKADEPDLKVYNKIYITESSKTALALILGDPSNDLVEIVDIDELTSTAWANPRSLAIIPFEDLAIEWKVLRIDGRDPLDSQFDDSYYELTIPIRIEAIDIPITALKLPTLLSNFDPGKLSSVALTGVTALVRDTASLMEENGMTYPAENIKELLANVSITHISNEVPFAEDCPSPDPNQGSFYFCSKDNYIELLEIVGTDIVELSGDHINDWGLEAIYHSLDLYRDRGWLTYGGGETLQIGLEPVFIEHNGNSFAFIGCNGKAHDKYASATDSKPGASRCNFDWMINKITQLSSEGYIVITTIQHEEVDSFNSIAIQQYDFGRLANAGSTIVSGSQAHHPQAFDYTGSSFIHYGLGNLFFDQWYLAKYNADEHVNKDKSFIDIHYFYNGAHINTRLITLKFIDNAQTRFMSFNENETFLTDVFRFSVWEGKPLMPYIR
jgi:poly-gamma-glutamate synthesis protein (capsule biosynthesis protein)